jgi:hypothetical protein
VETFLDGGTTTAIRTPDLHIKRTYDLSRTVVEVGMATAIRTPDRQGVRTGGHSTYGGGGAL